MKKLFLLLLVTVLLCPVASAQKAQTFLGYGYTGLIKATNETTREITIEYPDKDKTLTYTAVLPEKYILPMPDGSEYELKMSDLPVGTRVRIVAKKRDEKVGGQKVNVNRIFFIEVLGKDQFARMRSALKLHPDFPVKLDESAKLPARKPLKVYFFSHEPTLAARLVNWVVKWNREEADKFGPIEAVTDFNAADVSLIVLKQSRMIIQSEFFLGAGEEDIAVAVFLMNHKAGELEVVWNGKVFTRHNSSLSVKNTIEKEFEKRLKARF